MSNDKKGDSVKTDIRAILEMGMKDLPNDFHLRAGRHFELAKKTIPKMVYIVYASLIISLAAMLFTVWNYFSIVQPLVLLSFQDGSVLCAPHELDKNGKPIPRVTKEYVDYCASLEDYRIIEK